MAIDEMKRNIERIVEAFKAKLVLKWYTKKAGINYNETFSLVTMLKFICIFLLNYDISQVDIKITFLNGHLDKSVYMMQIDGFIMKG